MGIVFRQSVKSTIATFTGAFLGAICNFIYPYIFSKTELGLFTTIIYLGALLQIFMMLGTGSTIGIFTQKYPENDERRKVLLSFSSIITFLTTVLFTIIYIIFKEEFIARYQPEDQALVREYFYWVPVIILLMSFMSLCESYLLSHTKTAISAFAREILLRILNLILIALFFYQFIGFKAFIIGSILVYLVPILFLFFISSRTKGFGFSTKKDAFSQKEYREIIRFSWYHLLFGISMNLLGYIDTLMLSGLDKTGMESVAPYRIAVFIIAVMVIPYRAISSSSQATLNQAYIDNDMPKLHNLFTRAGVNIQIVAVGMLLIVACNLDNLVNLLPAGYAAIKPVVLILLIGRFIDMCTGLNNELISISKYYKFNFRVSVLLVLLTIGLCRKLIPEYGIYGAAWSVSLALAAFNLFKLAFLWWKMKLLPFSKNSLLIIAAGAAAGVAGYYLPYFFNSIADTLLRTAIIIFIYSGLLILLRPSEDLTQYLKSVRQRRRLF